MMIDDMPKSGPEERVRELEVRLEQLTRENDELRAGNAQNRALIENLPHEVHVWRLVRNEDGSIRTWRLVYANRSALRNWGVSLEDVEGRLADEIFPGESATELFLPVVEKIFREEQPHVWERFFPATGQTLQMVSIPFGETFISTGLDISEQKQKDEWLKHLHKMEAIGQLAGGFAHGFNNQLAVILGNAEILEDALTESPLIDEVRTIRAAAREAGEQASQLLAFAQKDVPKQNRIDVRDLVDETVALVRSAASRKISIRLRNLTSQAAVVQGDARELQTALLNVALNACDAMPEGGSLEVETSLIDVGDEAPLELDAVTQHRPWLCISFADTGYGISEEAIKKIFDPFFTTKAHGSGMGLAVAYGAIQRHGGHMLVDSRVGKGTRFRVFLPALGMEAEGGESSTGAAKPTDRLRILVADDEVALRKLFTRMLEISHHEVLTASDGEEAVARYREHWRDIDAVILDINMPRKDGLETLREMKEINPDVVAIVITGYSVEKTSGDFMEEGVRTFIQKPFETSDVIGALRDALGERVPH